MKIRRLIFSITVLISFIFGFGRIFAEEPNPGAPGPERKENAMAVQLKWLGHASFRISEANTVIYIDPWKLKESPRDATVVFVSHSHFDHYSAEDIARVSGMTTKLIAAGDVIQQYGKGQVLKPGQTIEAAGIKLTGVPAYNPAKKFHPRANNWLGVIIEIAGKRIYYAGDTDLTDEMKTLKNIDLALLPVGGTYTMTAAEAADATKQFKPRMAIPYHWGDIVGGREDADTFEQKAACKVKVLEPGDSITID
jgi:L-ascorbate metabolism protein UlaG (beta-lactamase superfamily)